jgi:YggT family protein
MSFEFLALSVRVIAQLFIWIVIASALLSFFLPPYHPIREALARIVDPFLNPIRSLMPGAGMIDFSPLILIFAVEILSRILISILLSL